MVTARNESLLRRSNASLRGSSAMPEWFPPRKCLPIGSTQHSPHAAPAEENAKLSLALNSIPISDRSTW